MALEGVFEGCSVEEHVRQRATRSRGVGDFKVRKHSNSVGACGHEKHGERPESPAMTAKS